MATPVALPPTLAPLRTVRDLIRWGASEFGRANLVFGHGTDNALDEAFHLVLWRLKLPLDLPATYLEANLDDDEREAVFALLSRRLRMRKPAAYLTNIAWFAGLEFDVDERVLIPRSPIAELIEAHFTPWLPRQPKTILDLCAGSGCIGIACAYAFPEATVDLSDISEGALEVAKQNIARHHVGARVKALIGDLFAPVKRSRYDLIVCNPPYVPTEEYAALSPEFLHEPERALEGGADGMDLVERVLRESPKYLADDGVLICEVGGSQQEFYERFKNIPVAWPRFERGGDGVFVIAREALAAWLPSYRRPRRATQRTPDPPNQIVSPEPLQTNPP